MNTPPVNTPKDMLGRTGLVSVAAARKCLLDALCPDTGNIESLPIEDALGRVLAAPVRCSEDLPPHPRSVMDGYAVIAADTFGASETMPCYLQITGGVAMGEMPTSPVHRGTCQRIATGGFLPPGADAVVMHEHTVPVDDSLVEVVKSVGTGMNIIRTGDDVRAGSIALSAGQRLRPMDLGLLAGLGEQTVSVRRRVRVAIVATGDEIVDFRQQPKPGQIRNINSPALAGLCREAGAEPVDLGIVNDEEQTFFSTLRQAVAEHDLVLFSGGSSVGIRDLGERAVASLGPPGILVHGVALKPGKPVLIGLSGTTPVFGLPGHPVSAMVCFDLFVKPAIRLLEGQSVEPWATAGPTLRARLMRNVNSAPGRLDIVRVRLEHHEPELRAEPVLGKSGAISSLSRAHGFFMIDEASQGVLQNSIVEVYPYS